MKKLLVLSMVLLSLSSCEKEDMEPPIIACECNDGYILNSTNPESCGTYVVNYGGGVSVTLHHGGFKKYIRSTKTFCEVFPSSASCLGRNY
jgi:hypothetical protein